MALLLDDVRAFLVDQGVVPSGFVIYEGYIPDDQDQVIAVFETGGFPAGTLGRENEFVTFQTRVRTKRLDYATCHATWKGIFDALQDGQIDASYYLIQAMHFGPAMFYDDRGRANMTSNWKVLRARS